MSDQAQQEETKSRAPSPPPSNEVAPPLISAPAKDEEAKKGQKRRGKAPRSASRPVPAAAKKTVTLVPGSEAMKERLKQAKAVKEGRKSEMDSRHDYILQKLAEVIGIDGTVVEDFILGDEKFPQIHSFFALDGIKRLMFFYQECNLNRIDLSSQAANSPKKLFISNGNTEGLTGQCYIFLRMSNNKNITTANIAQEVNFMTLDTSKGSILEGFEKLLGTILIPALQKQESWGEMSQQLGQVQEFVESLQRFVGILSGAKENVNTRVELGDNGLSSLLDSLKTPGDYIAAASNPDIIDKLEGLIALWSKEIEQVLAESEQMRKEADDIGPMAELDHWKKRMAKFNVLLDQIKSAHCKAAVGVLHAAKSRSLKHWKEMDSRITDSANEAKDNVKYLYTLDKFFGPLIKCSPTEMIEYVPSLVNAIRMIHSISQYYNTSERMTSLFVKVTNQMITTCKAYINRGVSKIWDHKREELSGRLKECIALNQEYQKCFQRTKLKLRENPKERQFEFSENYIFGKFDAFCKRLEKIDDMLTTMDNLSGLTNFKIEGVETIVVRYATIVANVKKKSYDLLDHRKGEFDSDYEEFKENIEGLKQQLQAFVDSWFEKPLSTLRSLELLSKFESISGVQLYLQDKYYKVLMQYGKDLETCRKMYQKQKNDPPILRNLPPIAGKITWAKQLFRRIHEPMVLFKRFPEILKSEDAKRLIKSYNKMAAVLVEFEVLYHRGWYRAVETAKSGLHASLLVRHPETKALFVNFDPQILELIQEAKCMARLNLEVPNAAQVLRLKEEQIKSCSNRLSEVLQYYAHVVSSIPEVVLPLMKPFTDRVDETIKPGLTMLNWTSMNISAYIDNIQKSVQGLERLSKEIRDILDCRIEAGLKEMGSTPLCYLPEEDAMCIEDFVKITEKTCNDNAEALTK